MLKLICLKRQYSEKRKMLSTKHKNKFQAKSWERTTCFAYLINIIKNYFYTIYFLKLQPPHVFTTAQVATQIC